MLSTATFDVVRLVSAVVRGIDARLVQSAVRNAESSLLAAHRRWLDEMATLSELSAIQGITADVEALPTPRMPELVPA